MDIPTKCPKCGSDIKHIPAGVSKKTGKPYNEFYACSNRECGYVYREPRGSDQRQGSVIEKKLNQILYLLTGINVDSNPEEFKQILTEQFGKGLLKK